MGEFVQFSAGKKIKLQFDGHLTEQMAMKPLCSPSMFICCVPETQEEIGSPSICFFNFFSTLFQFCLVLLW